MNQAASLVELLQAILEGSGRTKKKKQPVTVEVPARIVQAVAYALLERGYSHLLLPELWHPTRTNGVLIINRDWVERAITAIQTPRKVHKKPKSSASAAELLYSFLGISMQRRFEIPVVVFTQEILGHMGGFQDGEIAALIMKAVKSDPVGYVTLTRHQITTIVDFLDPAGAGERLTERQAAAAVVAEEIHRCTHRQRGRRVGVPVKLIRRALVHLSGKWQSRLERRLRKANRRKQVRMSRTEIFQLCDAIDLRGIGARKRASREAWETHRRSKNRGKNQGPKVRKKPRSGRKRKPFPDEWRATRASTSR